MHKDVFRLESLDGAKIAKLIITPSRDSNSNVLESVSYIVDVSVLKSRVPCIVDTKNNAVVNTTFLLLFYPTFKKSVYFSCVLNFHHLPLC